MPQPRRRPGFSHKAEPRRFITEISLTDDFQCHGAAQIYIERLVSDSHRTATQLNRLPVLARHQLVVVKSLYWPFRCRLDCLLERRHAGLHRARDSCAKHADRAEFHCSRKLVTAVRAGALGLRTHGPNRPSVESNTTIPRVARNRMARPLAYCCPVAQAIACSFILALQITFRNKIQSRRVPRRPLSFTTFDDGAARNVFGPYRLCSRLAYR